MKVQIATQIEKDADSIKIDFFFRRPNGICLANDSARSSSVIDFYNNRYDLINK